MIRKATAKAQEQVRARARAVLPLVLCAGKKGAGAFVPKPAGYQACTGARAERGAGERGSGEGKPQGCNFFQLPAAYIHQRWARMAGRSQILSLVSDLHSRTLFLICIYDYVQTVIIGV